MRNKKLQEKLINIAGEYATENGIEWDYESNACYGGSLWTDYRVYMSTLTKDGSVIVRINSKTLEPISVHRLGYYPEDGMGT